MSELHKRIAVVMKKYPDAYPTPRGLCVKQKYHEREELLLFWKGLDEDPMFTKEKNLPEVEEGTQIVEEFVPEVQEETVEEKPKRGRKPKDSVEVIEEVKSEDSVE